MKFLTFFAVLVSSQCAIPPNFQKCKRNDANFKNCLLKAAQDGVKQMTKPYKELNLPNAEPLEVTSLTVRGRGGVVKVDQNFKNCKIYGYTSVKIERFELDFDKKLFLMSGVVPEETINCEYQLDGKILVIPIRGEGNSTVSFKNFGIHFQATLSEFTKHKKTHLKAENSTMDAKPEQVSMHFDNLFNGNKELGDNLNQVLNENSKEIYEEIGDDYIELMNQVIRKLLNGLLSKVSVEELFD